MTHPLFFLCPNCFAEDSLTNTHCTVCQSRVGIRGSCIEFSTRQITTIQYEKLLQEKTSVQQDAESLSRRLCSLPVSFSFQPLRVSGKAVLRQGEPRIRFRGYHRLFQRIIERPVKKFEGHLIIFEDRAEFVHKEGTLSWPLTEFMCVTTNGHYFEFKVRRRAFYQIHFRNESPLKYEIIFQKWLRAFYEKEKKQQVLEFQPRLRLSPPAPACRIWGPVVPARGENSPILEKLLLNGIRTVLRFLLGLYIRVNIWHRQNWQRGQKGFVILNHQSALDPFIIGAYLDHRIAFLTKSTSFSHWFPRTFLKWTMGLPTTRYQTDPHILYIARKILRHNIKVGIFAEGERTWGGRLRNFKLSVIKLLMASREAVFPVIIQNSFKFWPRWAKRPRKVDINMFIGAPFCLIPDLYSIEEQKRFLEGYFLRELAGSGNGEC